SFANDLHESGSSSFRLGFPLGARVDESGRKQRAEVCQPSNPLEKSPLTSRFSPKVDPVSGASSPPAEMFALLRWLRFSKSGDASGAEYSPRRSFEALRGALAPDEHPASSVDANMPIPATRKAPRLRRFIGDYPPPVGSGLAPDGDKSLGFGVGSGVGRGVGRGCGVRVGLGVRVGRGVRVGVGSGVGNFRWWWRGG